MVTRSRGIVVRRARLSDRDAIVRFNKALAQETEDRALDVPTLQTGVEAILQDSRKGWYAIAEESSGSREGVVVGQIMVTFEWSDWRNGDFWWLQSVYVDPSHRRQGIFRMLYEYVQQQAHIDSVGMCGFRLYVEEKNRAAHKAYAHLGFHKTIYQMFEKPFVIP